MPTPLKPDDCQVQGDLVLVSGAGANALANSLIQKHSVTVGELCSALGFINPKDITVGADGSISIKNKAVADKVNQLKSQGTMQPLIDMNCICA